MRDLLEHSHVSVYSRLGEKTSKLFTLRLALSATKYVALVKVREPPFCANSKLLYLLISKMVETRPVGCGLFGLVGLGALVLFSTI